MTNKVHLNVCRFERQPKTTHYYNKIWSTTHTRLTVDSNKMLVINLHI